MKLLPALASFSFALWLAGCASPPSRGASRPAIPPPGNYRHDHYAYAEYPRYLAQHASRAIIERQCLEDAVTPHEIVGRAEFMAIPPSMPPSKRALILLEHWPHALYVQMVDDVRVLACFDAQDRLVAYELF